MLALLRRSFLKQEPKKCSCDVLPRSGQADQVALARWPGEAVVRELVGVYEFVTAPFPVPAGYQPILRPEYPWDYFE